MCWIQDLAKAGWSVSEMLHAIALLAHIHALTSFIYGCGINAELDQEIEGHTYDTECDGAADVDCDNKVLFTCADPIPQLQVVTSLQLTIFVTSLTFYNL